MDGDTVAIPSPPPASPPPQVSTFGGLDVELISPANERQISRAMPSFGSTLIHETPDMYQKVVYPYIKSIVDSGSLDWINNVIDGKKETERLLVDTSQFVVSIDTKWRSHPPPLTTPREEWFGHPSVEDLYCLAIVKKEKDSSIIATLRDLRGEHIPMLKNLQKDGLTAIEKIYGIQSDQIRCFVHYQPQFYHFHVHFTRLENEVGSTVERGHLLIDIIQNLEMDPLYYTKRKITYKLKKQSPLHTLFIESNRTESNHS
jgi:m7GpppX diphosphatase